MKFPLRVRNDISQIVYNHRAVSDQKKLLERYVQAVLDAPASLGLTATRVPAEFWQRHVLDALKLLELVPTELHQQNLRAIDVGSGNGVPGIPVAIALPRWSVVVLESNNKKSGFLDLFCKFNKIGNVTVVTGRSELVAHQSAYRGQFDIAFARALGKLPTALELSIPFLRVGGQLIVPHGTSYEQELESSQYAIQELGTSLQQTIPYSLSDSLKFTALLFKKDHETKECYPRKPGMPKKDPL
jgi:16S rRNA (guanine527-N7)-methyltransferase